MGHRTSGSAFVTPKLTTHDVLPAASSARSVCPLAPSPPACNREELSLALLASRKVYLERLTLVSRFELQLEKKSRSRSL